jgi:hypothetical protein
MALMKKIKRLERKKREIAGDDIDGGEISDEDLYEEEMQPLPLLP